MATWPGATISTANLDSDSDRISSARADLYLAVSALNDIIQVGLANVGNIEVNLGSVVTTNTEQTITANKSFAATTTLTKYIESVYSLGNVSGALTPNYMNGAVQTLTLTGNVTLNVPANMPPGGSITLVLTQDATGGRLLSASSSYYFSGGLKTLSTIANYTDILGIFYDGSKYLSTLSKAYVQ